MKKMKFFFSVLWLLNLLWASEGSILEYLEKASKVGSSLSIPIMLAKDIYHFSTNVRTSFSESKNFTEFLRNIDPHKRHHAKVEVKLEEIQNSIEALRRTVDNLEFSVDLKHFNSHAHYRTKDLYHAVQRFLELPSNHSKTGLIKHCNDHSPLSILERLVDILGENWLVDQARHYKYESTALKALTQKVDKIVEILVISQAACAGMLEPEDAKRDLRDSTEAVKRIASQIKRSTGIIENVYFLSTKSVVKEYLMNLRRDDKDVWKMTEKDVGKLNAKIASDLLNLYKTKYNYGTLYTIGVSKTFSFILSSGMQHYGNLQQNHTIFVEYNNTSVFVVQSPFLCNVPAQKEYLDLLVNDLVMKCSKDSSLSEEIKTKCGNNFVCSYVPTEKILPCSWLAESDSANSNDVYASTGGVCRFAQYYLRVLITTPFPSHFEYGEIASRKPVMWKAHNYDFINESYEVTEKYELGRKKLFNYFEDVEKVVKEKLFIETFVELFPESTVAESSGSDNLRTTFSPPTMNLKNSEGQRYPKYTNIPKKEKDSAGPLTSLISQIGPKLRVIGENLVFRKFHGTIICENETSVGEDASVTLIEVDDNSSNDIIDDVRVRNSRFTVAIPKDANDWPSDTMELKLAFYNCCGYQGVKHSGILCDKESCEYFLNENDDYARFSGDIGI